MSNFPLAQPGVGPAPPFLGTFSSPSGLFEATRSYGLQTFGASITWVANLAIYTPVEIPYWYPVRRVYWVNGSVVGSSTCFAIYSANGTRIYTTGSVVTAGASAPQYVTPTEFWLPPGRYYFGVSNSGTTNTMWGSTAINFIGLRLGGLQQEAAALPLPALWTPAACANSLLPMCGVTWTLAGG